ncbi:hypothetical protein JRQ81_005524 [Phrynocephalus forsythii]|uniref:G-protein coupled receptors family 1 profile domain-containing protein n=1 Tax=Phrynocephalus forsythii TaxID=171643 RepID=A0A9Q0XIC2_9SAUR|nr:hypothetical protein JRQ81_005524 [Phrynocephalus forsythii]
MEGHPRKNSSSVTTFVFVPLPVRCELQMLISCAFLLIYTFTLIGNYLIIVVTVANPTLHTPMYFFLWILSILDICYSSVTIPKILLNLLTEDRSISFLGCAAQMFFLLSLGAAECVLLAVMAYDRYMAILLSGTLVGLVETVWVFSLPFCGSNKIDYFFCDIPPLLNLSCTDTSMFEIQLLTASVLVILTPFILILVSYSLIISSILAMTSHEGKWKTFSTCSSHITVVILYYGISSLIYIKPQSIFSKGFT